MSRGLRPSAAVTLPDQGRVLRAFGDEVVVHLSGEQTGGTLALCTLVSPPGGGPPVHYHTHEDESFLLQEGRVSFFLDGQWTEVPVGTTVFVPRTVVHSYKNHGDRPSRMLLTASPSGFEKFFARCADEFNKSGGPNIDRLVQIAGEHGIRFVD
ncbi:MAG TPA: cupin domain-containing protein [Verrucomicrobiae bacterium]|nr:cupin domain-containing protein [Verrucomicrobiae bacterium]